MSKPKTRLSKTLSIALSITTAVWLSGVSAFMPMAANAVTIVDGDTIRATGGIDVYIVKLVGTKKFKRLVLNPQVFTSYGHLKWENVKSVDQATLDAYTTADLVREINDDKVYKLVPDGDVGAKHWVKTLDAFTANSYDWDAVYTINATDRDNYTTGAAIIGGPGEIKETTPSGGITVSLDASSPAANHVPYGAMAEPFAKFKFDGSGKITQLTISRSGAGDADDFTNVYLYDGDNRLTAGRSISSVTSKVTFIGLSISAPKVITIVADLANASGDNGNVHKFFINAASDVVADTTVSGAFPVESASQTVAAVAGGEIMAEKSGTIANPKVGQKEIQVSEFKLTTSAEGVKIKRLAIYNAGTVNSIELTNLKLKVGTTTVATLSAWGSDDYATFIFDTPYEITKGDNKVFKLYADIGGKKDETIITYIFNDADVYAVGTTYGHGVKVDRGANTNDTGTFDGASTSKKHTITLEGGDVTVAFNGPAAAYVGDDTNDTVLLDITISAATNIEVKNLKFYICWNRDAGSETMANAGDKIEDIKLKNVDTGDIVMGPTDGSSWTQENDGSFTSGGCDDNTYEGQMYKTWTDAFDIDKGASKHLQLTADIKDSANTYIDTSDALIGIMEGLGDLTNPIKYRDSNQFAASTAFVPTQDITGNTMTVNESTISVALGSTPKGEVTTTKGQKGAKVQSLLFTAGTASDMTLTDLVLNTYVGASATAFTVGQDTASHTLNATEVVEKVYIYESDGTTAIPGSTSKGLSGGTNTSEATWSGLNWSIPAGTTKEMIVKVDVSTLATSSTTYAYFDIDAAADVAATDNKGNSVNPSAAPDLQTEDSPTVYFSKANNGTLTAAAAADGVKPRTTYAAIGDTGVVFNKVKFTSTIEAFTVDKVTIGTDEDIEDNDMHNAIKCVKVEYPKKDGSTGTTDCTSLSASTASVSFSDMSFYVPANNYAYLTVKADLKTYAEGASGDALIRLNFDGDGGATTEFHAKGEGSGNAIEADHAGIVDANGNYMELQRNYPKFSLVSLGGGSRSTLPTTLEKFKITAMGGDVVFSNASGSMQFRVYASGQDGGNITLSLYDDDTGLWLDDEEATGEGYDATNSDHSSDSFDFDQQSVTIAKGETKTFRVDITSGKSVFNENGDFIQLQMTDATSSFAWDNSDDNTGPGEQKAQYGNATFGASDDLFPNVSITRVGVGVPLLGDDWNIAGL